jgi:4-hydroxy-tetrahydrodipicolinate synthase
MPHHDSFWGVHPIVPTPFHDDGSIDLDSVRRLVDATIETAAQGIAVLGFMGESHKLMGPERRAVLKTAVERSAGRLPIWVGVRGLGHGGLRRAGRGGRGLRRQRGVRRPDRAPVRRALERHYRTVAAATALPMALHDYPESFGITLSVDLIARLARDGVAPYVKAEDPPVLGKQQRKVLAAADGAGSGSSGARRGVALRRARGRRGRGDDRARVPRAARRDRRPLRRRRSRGAAKVFDRVLPLIRYEFQPGIGVALRKHVFRRRGMFTTEVVRRPAPPVDAATLAGFEAVVERCGLRIDAPGWVDPPVAGPVPAPRPPRG